MFESAQNIMKMLNDSGYEAYLVGGCVRDKLLGGLPKDYDVATNAPSSFIENVLRGINISKNMNIGVYVVDSVEVAQFRIEIGHSDNRHPDTTEHTDSFYEDCQRRDFTINAMGIDLRENVIDFFGGQQDLQNKIIRAVGNPQDRFNEDCLRMLRAVRFAVAYDFAIEESTMEAIKLNAHKLNNLSGERVQAELRKIACAGSSKFADAILLMDECCLLGVIIPEIKVLQGLLHKKEHHPEGDVYQHTIEALRKAHTSYFDTILSVLFHDCGKALTYDSENITYYGHDEESFDIINKAADRLKLPNTTRECVYFCARNHMKMHLVQNMKKIKVYRLVESEYFDVLLQVYIADTLSSGKDYPASALDYIEKIKGNMIARKDGSFGIVLAVSGYAIMEYVEHGKRVGEIQRYLQESVAERPECNTKENLIALIEKYLYPI